MFFILNIRSIIDNFISYGIIFGQTPFEYLPIHYLLALVLLEIFPLLAFTIEKLRYRKYISSNASVK
jgi:hypothetical protein